MLAKLYTPWEHGVEVGKEELEKGCAKCWDMVSFIISWGKMLGVWHSITTIRRIDTTAGGISE